jgi:hypothetical protein
MCADDWALPRHSALKYLAGDGKQHRLSSLTTSSGRCLLSDTIFSSLTMSSGLTFFAIFITRTSQHEITHFVIEIPMIVPGPDGNGQESLAQPSGQTEVSHSTQSAGSNGSGCTSNAPTSADVPTLGSQTPEGASDVPGILSSELVKFHATCETYADEYRNGKATNYEAHFRTHHYVAAQRALVGADPNVFSHRVKGSGTGNIVANSTPRTGDQSYESITSVATRGKPSEEILKRRRRKCAVDESSDSDAGGNIRSRDITKRRRKLERSILAKGLPGGIFASAEEAAIAEANLPPALRIARQRINAFKQDKSASVNIILAFAGRPDFPESLWKQVIFGEYVDFEKLLAEYTYNSSEDRVNVSTFLEWQCCWDRYADAVTYIFKERSNEITAYGIYLGGLFRSFQQDVHDRIILYDAAVRKSVARQGDLLFTDHARFDDIFQSLLHPQGVFAYASGSGKSGKPKRGKTSEQCRRFNAGGCPDSANQCRFRHTCSSCKSPDHGQIACPQ